MAVEKIQIKDIDGNVLFEYECEGNTLKRTVEVAVSNRARLDGASLIGARLIGARLIGASLDRASLDGASLIGARLIGASLDGASLIGASLDGASLDGARLIGASLDRASLDGASLIGASLDGASLDGASLIGASLDGASLDGASLDRAQNIPYIPIWCPSDGPFIGWKKVGSCLVKLLIPYDAERCSATTRKCRCSKAMVVSILDLDTKEDVQEITNKAYTPEVTYKVGEMVLPDAFDKDRWNECSNGIHFFINKQDAIDYNG